MFFRIREVIIHMDDIRGIDENSFENPIRLITDYANQLSQRFTQLDEIMEATKVYYDSPTGNSIREKYIKVKNNYDIAKNNILTYAEDLRNVKTSYTNFEDEVSAMYSKYGPSGEAVQYEGRNE